MWTYFGFFFLYLNIDVLVVYIHEFFNVFPQVLKHRAQLIRGVEDKLQRLQLFQIYWQNRIIIIRCLLVKQKFRRLRGLRCIILLQFLLDELCDSLPFPIDILLLFFLLILQAIPFQHQANLSFRFLKNVSEPIYGLFEHLLVFALVYHYWNLGYFFFEVV